MMGFIVLMIILVLAALYFAFNIPIDFEHIPDCCENCIYCKDDTCTNPLSDYYGWGNVKYNWCELGTPKPEVTE